MTSFTASLHPRSGAAWNSSRSRDLARSSCARAHQGRREALLQIGALVAVTAATQTLTLPAGKAEASEMEAFEAEPAQGRYPTAEEQAAIDGALAAVLPRGRTPAALRLVFHDAGTYTMGDGTGGANGSIRFELDRRENANLRKAVRTLDEAMAGLKGTAAEGKVSFADLVMLAGAYSVRVCGGPVVPIKIGRIDAQGPDPADRLPQENFNSVQLKATFQAKGFSTRDLVALSGAHTVGGKGFGNPTAFDNEYFKVLLRRPWEQPGDMNKMIGLPSDHVLPDDDESYEWVQRYAKDQELFFADFTSAFARLSELGARWAVV